MGSTEKNVALVFGASGISGWAVTKNLLTYPTSTTFSRIIALTHRPMELEHSQLPTDDKRLEFYHGVNLRETREVVIEQMKTIVPNVEEVTHVYYLGQFFECDNEGEVTDRGSLRKRNCVLERSHGAKRSECSYDW